MKYSSKSSSDKFADDIDPFRCRIFSALLHCAFGFIYLAFKTKSPLSQGYELLHTVELSITHRMLYVR